MGPEFWIDYVGTAEFCMGDRVLKWLCGQEELWGPEFRVDYVGPEELWGPEFWADYVGPDELWGTEFWIDYVGPKQGWEFAFLLICSFLFCSKSLVSKSNTLFFTKEWLWAIRSHCALKNSDVSDFLVIRANHLQKLVFFKCFDIFLDFFPICMPKSESLFSQSLFLKRVLSDSLIFS